jgi:hypothetical protein
VFCLSIMLRTVFWYCCVMVSPQNTVLYSGLWSYIHVQYMLNVHHWQLISTLSKIKWLFRCPHVQNPVLHLKHRIAEGIIKRGSTIDHCRSQCKGQEGPPLKHSFIHTRSSSNLICSYVQSLLYILRLKIWNSRNSSHYGQRTKSKINNAWYMKFA